MAAGMKTGNTPDVVPRTFDAYFEPEHVGKRFECDRRPIERAYAGAAIKAGDVEGNPIDRDGRAWRFRLRLAGCDVVVGCADAQEYYRDFVVLTAYVDVVDAREAWSSGPWSNEDVYVAGMLQYLKSDVHVTESGLRPEVIDVTEPVEYDGHRLIFKNGYSTPVCVDCGRKSTAGDDYKRSSCR